MKVGNSSDKSVGSVSSTRAVGEGRDATESKVGGKAKSDAASGSASTVKLSKAAQMLANASASSDFDAEKVDRIRKSIEDGSYKVNHEAIADKLIANAQDVLGGGRSR